MSLSGLTRSLPYVLPIAVVLVVLIMVILWFQIRGGRKRAAVAEAGGGEGGEAPDDADAQTVDLTRFWRLRASFSNGIERLRQLTTGSDFRYQIPWILMLGQAGSRPPDLLEGAGLNLPVGPPDEEDLRSGLGCAWWFFDRGVVLDLAGEYVLRADGRTASDGGWRAFLRLLQRHRPERPIDGIVVTLACADLLRALQDPDGLPEIEQRANLLFRRLQEAQKELGLRLPISIVVTGCERFPGFSAVAEALTDSQRYGMVGWSNPYRIDAGYRNAWVDEAFNYLRKRLHQLEVGFLAGRLASHDAHQLFKFPYQLELLREPLRSFVTGIFRSSVYQEAAMLRGIYMCGSGAPATVADIDEELADEVSPGSAAAGRGTADSAVRPRMFFLRDLLERKVFPEATLATPTTGTVLARNRKVRVAQILLVASALLIALGLWRAQDRLARREPALRDLLGEILTDVRTASPEYGSVQRQMSYRLLEAMARTDLDWYGSTFIPSSWSGVLPVGAGGYDEGIRRSIVQAFDRVVLPWMAAELEQRAQSLLRGAQTVQNPMSPMRLSARQRQVLAIHQMPEFVDLRDFVQGFVELQRNGDRYNSLSDSPRIGDFAQLAGYLLGGELSEGLLRHDNLVRRALDERLGLHAFRSEIYEGPGGQRALALARRFYAALEYNALSLTLGDLHERLQSFRAQPEWLEGEAPVELESLLSSLDGAAELLPRPEYAWLFSPEFSLGQDFDDVLIAMGESRVLRGVRDAVIREGQQRLVWLQSALLALGPTSTGPLLQRSDGMDPLPLAELSDIVAQLRVDIAGLINASFMPPEVTRSFAIVDPEEVRLFWDTLPLEQAAELYESYGDYWRQSAPGFPSEVRGDLEDVVRQRIGRHLGDLIAEAQRTEPLRGLGLSSLDGDQVRDEIETLQAASPHLNRLVAIFEGPLDLDDSARQLSDLMARHVARLLGEVDAMVTNARVYLPRGDGFDWWTGGPPVVREAFGIADNAALASYLAAQYEEMRSIAGEYAAPLLASLGSTRGMSRRIPALARWERTIRELERYESQTPGNSVAALESFVQVDLADVTLGNCSVRMAAEPGRPSEDFFLQRREYLRQGLHRRCLTLVREVAALRYTEVERFFNERLAGRHPFADVNSPDTGSSVQPDVLRRFFELFDRNADLIAGLPEDLPLIDEGSLSLREFVSRMRAARALFAPFLESAPGGLPAFDLKAEYRVNRDQEVGGSQIIQWDLDVAGQVVGDRREDPALKWRWVLGDRIRLTLRWARDGHRAPITEGLPREGFVRGGAVVYEYFDLWSLLTLIGRHRGAAQDFGVYDDPENHTLRFVVQTRATGEEAVDPVEAVRVYIRVILLAPDTERRLEVPSFPARAPRLIASGQPPSSP